MAQRIDLWTYGATTKHDVLAAWNAGKDFVIAQNGMHCSIRDYPDLKVMADTITLRWLGEEHFQFHKIWMHPLTGLTTYV